MTYEQRERLATEFAGVIRTVREKKWLVFKKAAAETDLDPYVALARMLARIVENVVDAPPRRRRLPDDN